MERRMNVSSFLMRHLAIGIPSTWVAAAVIAFTISSGCSLNRFITQKEKVFQPEVTKSDIVRRLNKNIVGNETSPGVSSWKTSSAKVQVTGIPFPLPASLAVESPRNLRILVTHPITGGQEVDLGSNQERFWLWTKEQPEMITCRHEDISVALRHFEMPIQIHPEWLMEVFGVAPIDEDEFRLEHPSTGEPYLDLVASRKSPTGQSVDRVIRVNVYSGNIEEHLLRSNNGEVIASAKLDKYTEMANGTQLPTFVKITWPAAKTEMKISLGQVEVNPASFAVAHSLWEMPNHPGSKVVDIGKIGRLAVGNSARVAELPDDPANNIRQLRHVPVTEANAPAGKVTLSSTQDSHLSAPSPFGTETGDSQSSAFEATGPSEGMPVWAQGHTTDKPVGVSSESVPVVWQRSRYSQGASQSSSVPRPQGQE